MSLTRRDSPLAALRSMFLLGSRSVFVLRDLRSLLLQRDTADPVSSNAFMGTPPMDTSTSGRLSPEYLMELSRLKQVIRHWGRFLLNTSPRDRFPRPGRHRRWGPNRRSNRHIASPEPPGPIDR